MVLTRPNFPQCDRLCGETIASGAPIRARLLDETRKKTYNATFTSACESRFDVSSCFPFVDLLGKEETKIPYVAEIFIDRSGKRAKKFVVNVDRV